MSWFIKKSSADANWNSSYIIWNSLFYLWNMTGSAFTVFVKAITNWQTRDRKEWYE